MDATVITNLTDVTFVIPVRIDTPQRARNLNLVIDFIIRNFDSKILVMEADSHQRFFVQNDCQRIQYFFVEDHRPIFHRTSLLNHLCHKVDTPIIAGWETDALVAPEQIIATVEQIRAGKAVLGLPYDGRIYRTLAELTQIYQDTQNLDVLIQKKIICEPSTEFYLPVAFLLRTQKKNCNPAVKTNFLSDRNLLILK